MGTITSGIGLISGINTGNIVNQLIAIDAQPVQLLQSQSDVANAQAAAYAGLANTLASIQAIGNTLALPQTFQNTTTTSSDDSILTATSGVGAAVGSYQLQVARLVTTQQSISQGYADPATTPIGAGTITLEEGGGQVSSQTPLADLNGGAGVQQGEFRITDGSGNSAVINTSDDITLDDVVNQINSTLGISVKASITDQGLVLTDTSGKTTDELSVQDLAGGTAAASLGIAGTATNGVLTGSNINYINSGTALSQLNDGLGITTTTAGQTDFTVTTSDGSKIAVSLNGASTVGDVINDINTVGGAKLKAGINADGNGITLTDTSGGGGTLSIAAQNGSSAAADLGLTAPATGNTIDGKPLIAGLDSVLVSSLNGGSGLPLGTISITDRAGTTGQINLSGATSVSDIINDINNNTAGVKVTAAINSSGTGIQIVDDSGGAGNLTIGDVNSTTAAALGISGTFGTGQTVVSGTNLQPQYISNNTLLSSYNGGQGVTPGQFTVTNSKGISATIDTTQGTFNTIGDVINAINAKNIGVTASINSKGNGILLTDTAGGPQKLTVTDDGGTTAQNLNIAGTATGTTIDGAEEKQIAVTSTDTLNSLVTKINQAGFGVSAAVIDDGSGSNPYRLSLTSYNSGAAGQVTIDTGTTSLNVQNLVQAQDAAVFYGGGSSSSTAQPILITSNTNQLSNLIQGVNISLTGASSSPVTLNVTLSSTAVSSQLQTFVTDFNSVVSQITAETGYDTTTNTGGILLGDSTVQQIQSSLYNIVNTVVDGAGVYNDLSDVGITIGSGAQLNFDAATFQNAFASNPTAVQNLFSQATTGLGNVIGNTIDSLTDPVTGAITLETQTLSSKVQTFQDSINTLNAVLAQTRTQLETQFSNMEVALADLQSQSSVLGTLSTFNSSLAATTSAAASASSSSSSGSSSASTSA